MQNGQEVRVNSLSPKPELSDYRVDFSALDRDNDGDLSRSEAAADETLGAQFDAVDRNEDGRLSRYELSDWTR
ncbi:hypothetical protein QFW77_04085 [Luteimonas sp. RD2P54]|uniref:EF-hand domain-containing protein n=1 Tax=Luteimonas endophytica TaxID=3042023 RepID=A0ABT6J5X2_9GAMM|nr:hypothetical protein [Luteimonas endophytica]MDH5822169.1 hypothetical protein [Luteimonas endophytica]